MMRSTLAFSSLTAWSVEGVVDEVTSPACGWRWPTGADQGRVVASHPEGSASAVGAGAAVPPCASIDNWHSRRLWTVACAAAGATDISDRAVAIPASVSLIIGPLQRYAHHERFPEKQTHVLVVIFLRRTLVMKDRSHARTVSCSHVSVHRGIKREEKWSSPVTPPSAFSSLRISVRDGERAPGQRPRARALRRPEH
jgi:hypothetical protein